MQDENSTTPVDQSSNQPFDQPVDQAMLQEQQPAEPAQTPPTDYEQPVAYDVNGQPLYAHPSTPQPVVPNSQEPQAVHITRPVELDQTSISDAVKERHAESTKQYPDLNLSDSEYVIMAVQKHPIAMAPSFGIGGVLILLAIIFWALYGPIATSLHITGPWADPGTIVWFVLLFIVCVVLGMYVSYYVYHQNVFYLTNESVIERIQFSLMARREQTISLGSIEDVSFLKSGIWQYAFDYGTIRLSTIGDEDTYTFQHVSHPKLQLVTLNNAVEAFKNGRRVDPTIQ